MTFIKNSELPEIWKFFMIAQCIVEPVEILEFKQCIKAAPQKYVTQKRPDIKLSKLLKGKKSFAQIAFNQKVIEAFRKESKFKLYKEDIKD